jgi:hypothetical protein
MQCTMRGRCTKQETAAAPAQHLNLLDLPQPWLRSLLIAEGFLSRADKLALVATCRAACLMALGLVPDHTLQVRDLSQASLFAWVSVVL